MRATFLWVPLFSLCLLSACGRVNPDDDFARAVALSGVRPDAVHADSPAPIWRKTEADDGLAKAEAATLLEKPLTMDAAARVAVLMNPELQAAFEELGVAKADFVQAGLYRNPGLDMLFQFPLFSGGDRGTKTEVGGSFSVADLWLVPPRRKLAAVELEAATIETARALREAVKAARLAWIRAAGAEKAAKDAAALSSLTSEIGKEAGTLSRFGYATTAEVMEARIEAAKVKLEAETAQAEARAARLKLERTLGLYEPPAFTLAELPPLGQSPLSKGLPLNQPDENGLVDAALARRLDIALARAKVELAARRMGLESANVLQDVDLGAAYEKEMDGKEIFGPTLHLKLPIFDQNLAQKARAGFLLRQAKRNLAAAELAAREEILTGLDAARLKAGKAARLEKDLLPMAEQSRKFASTYASGMEMRRTDWLEIRKKAAVLALETVQARTEALAAQAELEYLVGGW